MARACAPPADRTAVVIGQGLVYDPDALRFYLIPIAPETRDLEFS